MTEKKILNFGAGPAKLPQEVLKQVQGELLDYHGEGISILETSHRSKVYSNINDGAQRKIRDLLSIPENFKILFLQGGGTGQFASIPLNLIGKTGKADYIVTGNWSRLAAKEAEQYGQVNYVLPESKRFVGHPPRDQWKFSPDASYVYYCDNETVYGVEFPEPPETKGVPLVADMSSNFLTRPIDFTKFGAIFAGAQKNIGPAGVTVVIVREDLLGNALPVCPTVLNYSIMARDNSLHNTPPVFSVYVMDLVFDWIKRQGGLKEMHQRSKIKSEAIYNAMIASKGFYSCPVQSESRSRINIPFRIEASTPEKQTELEEKFLAQAQVKGMIQLKGHRSVGGIRASLYNAVGVEDAQALADFMLNFYKEANN
ncbi:probable phosphoserine aminotransferase [Neocloeon triangulifer]|uniref:probable phosphoserine aminotransferase n=1 Tax=Neocloeon triangulifer TaxID=2078957 RepID=UPI00286F8FDE|nr:probable phosphoserine aminotransferase [Neocloeon triangulifer]